jgi:hypothetical protein
MGREDLIGPGKKHLVPAFQPAVMGAIKQSDGTVFKAKPLPKAFNNMKNAARPASKTGKKPILNGQTTSKNTRQQAVGRGHAAPVQRASAKKAR